MSDLSLLRALAGGAPGLELLPLVLLLAVKATVIVAAAGLVARLLGRAPAAARHLVWCCAVAALLLLPFFSLALPDWEVAMWRETGSAWVDGVASPVETPRGAGERRSFNHHCGPRRGEPFVSGIAT